MGKKPSTTKYLSTTTATYVADEPFSVSLFAARFYGRRPAYGGWLEPESKKLEAGLEQYVTDPSDRIFLHACLDQGSTPKFYAKSVGVQPKPVEDKLRKLVAAIPKDFFDAYYPTLDTYNERTAALSDYVQGTAKSQLEQLSERCEAAEAKAKALDDRLAELLAEDSDSDARIAVLEAELGEAKAALEGANARLAEWAEQEDVLKANVDAAMKIAEDAEAERRAVQSQFDELVAAAGKARQLAAQVRPAQVAEETAEESDPNLVTIQINPYKVLGRKLAKELRASGITAEQMVTCTYHQLEVRLSTNRPGDTVRELRKALDAAKIPHHLT